MTIRNNQLMLLGSILLSLCLNVLLAGCAAHPPKEDAQAGGAISPKESATLNSSETALINQFHQRYGEYYAKRMTLFLKEQKTAERGKIVFLGDSITEGLPTHDAFPGGEVINRGISGDTVLGVTSRLEYCIAPLAPRKIYLLISVNDLNAPKPLPIPALLANYEKLLEALRKAAPHAEIVMQSVMPTCDGFDRLNPRIREMNQGLVELAAREKLQYLDLCPALTGPDGRLQGEFTGDGLHLNMDGDMAWLKAVLSTDDYINAALALSPRWAAAFSPIHPIDAVDPVNHNEYPGSRGPDELIVYSPKYGKPSTGTNEWGKEAIVENDRILRQCGGNSPIPANGYVVSGHGMAGDWIAANMIVGAKVVLGENRVEVLAPEAAPLSQAEQARGLRSKVLLAVAAAGGANAPAPLLDEARKIFREVMEIEANPKTVTAAQLLDLQKRIESLKSLGEAKSK